MSPKRPSRKALRGLCAEVHAEDGLDPRLRTRSVGGRNASRRKLYQLCGQVAETIGQVLAGGLDDDVLRGLYVASVLPAPNATRLLVTLASFPSEPVDPIDALGRLETASGRIRYEVAAAIHRRKAPTLAYRVVIPGT